MKRVAPATLPSGEDGGSKRKEAPNEGPRAPKRVETLGCLARARGETLSTENIDENGQGTKKLYYE